VTLQTKDHYLHMLVNTDLYIPWFRFLRCACSWANRWSPI